MLSAQLTGGGTMFIGSQERHHILGDRADGGARGMTLRESYALCDSWVLEAVQGLGVPAFYRPINDIATAEGKIGEQPNAAWQTESQFITPRCHGIFEGPAMLAVTRLFRDDLGTRGAKSAQKKVVGISHYCGASKADVVVAMIESLESGRAVRRGTYRPSRTG